MKFNLYINLKSFFNLDRNVFFNFFNLPSSFLVKSRTLLLFLKKKKNSFVFLNKRTQIKSVKNSFNMTRLTLLKGRSKVWPPLFKESFDLRLWYGLWSVSLGHSHAV